MKLSTFAIQAPHAPHVNFLYLPRQQEIDAGEMIALLHPQELSYYQSCKSEARRGEFLRSRWLIKKVLHQHEPFSTWPRTDAGIRWPLGIQASLSHKSGDVLFAYTHESLILGVDLEESDRDLRQLKNKIMTEAETSHVTAHLGHPISSQEIAAVFSFKESVFKCLHAKVGQWFWFHDVEISSWDKQAITCQLKRSLGPYPKGTEIRGSTWNVAINRLATCVIHPGV